ncbi:MAG: FAD-binding oxidoreductase [Anaerolineae bacterium]|nr:FAD-binding oxidoreductase [Anaerolineae bacterium]
MKQGSKFVPRWFEGELPERSFRSLFKWGDSGAYKHPNRRLYAYMRDTFGLIDDDFRHPLDLGLNDVPEQLPGRLSQTTLETMINIVGEENVDQSTYHRLRCGYGAGMLDVMRLREGIIENLPDLVVYPRTKEEVVQVIQHCSSAHIPLMVRGGGSTVTRGYEAPQGGIVLDMARHMKRVLDLNETDQTITVEAGMFGPALELIINQAPSTLGAQRPYTLGHFPQSFEYSSVGGWIVTRGAGQNSTYYGKIEDLVLGQEYATPHGLFCTPAFPRAAIGPDMNQIMMGGEGTLGVLVNATLKLSRFQPENTRYFAFVFRTWEDGVAAMREIMQGEFGKPSVFRLSDAEETDAGLKLYGVEGTPAETLVNAMGYQPMQRCLMLGTVDGDRAATRLVKSKIKRICGRYRALNLSGFHVAQMWEHSRFRDPYLRDDMQDFGILTDTLECAVRWSQVELVHQQVRAFVKSRPRTICTCHISHAYPQGCNLYFIFIAKIDSINEYLDLQYGILEAIQQSGAAISHHHGIGKQTGPWFAEQQGIISMGLLHAIKDYLDPEGILNPGGTLGLDMSNEQRNKRWGYRE